MAEKKAITMWWCSECGVSYPESAARTTLPHGDFGRWVCPPCALTLEKGYKPEPLRKPKPVRISQPQLFEAP